MNLSPFEVGHDLTRIDQNLPRLACFFTTRPSKQNLDLTILRWLHNVQKNNRVTALERVRESPLQGSLSFWARVYDNHDPSTNLHILLCCTTGLLHNGRRLEGLARLDGGRNELRLDWWRPDSDRNCTSV